MFLNSFFKRIVLSFRLSDRVITMYEGRITGEFSAAEISREEIGYCMTGGRREEAQA